MAQHGYMRPAHLIVKRAASVAEGHVAHTVHHDDVARRGVVQLIKQVDLLLGQVREEALL